MKYLLPLFAVVLLFAGCMSVDKGYTANNPVARHSTTAVMKFPVCYSVEYEKGYTDIEFPPKEAEIRKRTEDALHATDLFSEVIFSTKPETNTYHIAFKYVLQGTDIDSNSAMLAVSAATVFLIPCTRDASFDGSATIYYKGTPIYATAATELHRRYCWLPLLPAGIFMNSAVVFDRVTEGVVHSLVNDVAREHTRRYLKQ